MQLHLIRHAEAEHSLSNRSDINRKLSDTGKRQANALANYLSSRIKGIEVWCSSAQRTFETSQLLAEVVEFSAIHYIDEFYLCSMHTFMAHLNASTSEDDLVILAHNFGISDLLNYYTDADIDLCTAEYVCIDFGALNRNELSKGTGIIVDRFHHSGEASSF